MDARVFICSHLPPGNSDRDFSSAQRYGRLEFILPATPSASLIPGPSFMTAARKLRDFDEDRDYLVMPGGDPVALLVCGLALAEMGVTDLNYLRWDRERDLDGNRKGSGFYVPSKIPLRLGANR